MGGSRRIQAMGVIALLAAGVADCAAPELPPVTVAPTAASWPPPDVASVGSVDASADGAVGRDAARSAAARTVGVYTPGPPGSAPGSGKTKFTDAEVAAAVSDPLGSSWVAPAPRTTRGSCWMRYERTPSSPLSEFAARNGWSFWPSPSPDPVTGALVGVVRRRSTPVGASASLTALDAARRARALLRVNADLFGLVESDFDRLDWEVMTGYFNAGTLVGWEVTATWREPAPPQPFPEIARRVQLHVTIQRDGEIVGVNARVHPDVAVCTRPRLTEDEARQTPGIVGRHLSFGDMSGRPVDAGLVQAADVGPAKLMILVVPDTDSREYRLVYQVLVTRDTMPWYFIVDAWTGKLLGVVQAFRT